MSFGKNIAVDFKKITSAAVVGVLLFTFTVLHVGVQTAQAVSGAEVTPTGQKMFLQVEGLNGDSRDQNYVGQFDVSNFSWSATATVGKNGGLGGGKASYGDLQLDVRSGFASPQFLQLLSNAKHIKKIVLTAQTEMPLIIITLSDAQIVGYTIDGSRQDDTPTDHLTITYKQLDLQYLHPNGLASNLTVAK